LDWEILPFLDTEKMKDLGQLQLPRVALFPATIHGGVERVGELPGLVVGLPIPQT
jgi:hypothetical protein